MNGDLIKRLDKFIQRAEERVLAVADLALMREALAALRKCDVRRSDKDWNAACDAISTKLEKQRYKYEGDLFIANCYYEFMGGAARIASSMKRSEEPTTEGDS